MAKFVVRLSREVSQAVQVRFGTDTGTAMAQDDYTTESGTLVIPAGDTALTISVATTDDGAADSPEPRAEAPEWFVLELQEFAVTPPRGVLLGVCQGEGDDH